MRCGPCSSANLASAALPARASSRSRSKGAKCTRAVLIFRGWVPGSLRIVRVRVFAVESVYAWRMPPMRGVKPGTYDTLWWQDAWTEAGDDDGGLVYRPYRTLYPSKAAALAARPSKDAVLVRVRRRVP